jgi:hypothetical protein
VPRKRQRRLQKRIRPSNEAGRVGVPANPKQFRQPGCRCFSAGPRALLHRPCGGSYGGSREARAAFVNQQLAAERGAPQTSAGAVGAANREAGGSGAQRAGGAGGSPTVSAGGALGVRRDCTQRPRARQRWGTPWHARRPPCWPLLASAESSARPHRLARARRKHRELTAWCLYFAAATVT